MSLDTSHIIETEFNLPEPLAVILNARGFTSKEDVRSFLYPDFAALPHPSLMHGMEHGVNIIIDAIVKKQPVIIHGDYDVDGITATVLLVQFFRYLGLETFFYIPNRLKDNYGLTVKSVNNILKLTEEREGVLVTVDCGISSVNAVNYAKEKGFSVVITDHHEPPETLPKADALINPKIRDCKFPFKKLSGAGVAFFFIAGIRRALIEKNFWNQKIDIPNLKQYLDLVALGTIADVMSLTGVNRILVRAGLEVLNQRKRIGVNALCEVCRIYREDMITPEDISFKLAPRINAAGRMGDADVAVELLLKNSYAESFPLSRQLDLLNNERKSMEKEVLQGVFDQCQIEVENGAHSLVIYSEKCHPGILGIIASRMVDKFGLPTIVLTNENKDPDSCLKGSGRSVKSVNMFKRTDQCKEYLKRFGGHPMAVGVLLEKENLLAFKNAFNNECKVYDTIQVVDDVVDYHIKEKEILSEEFMAKLQLLQPFGEGNPEPLFLIENEKLENVKEIRDHLKFTIVSHEAGDFSGIGFYMAEKKTMLTQGPVDIVFKVKRTSYRGMPRKEIQLIEVKPPAENLT